MIVKNAEKMEKCINKEQEDLFLSECKICITIKKLLDNNLFESEELIYLDEKLEFIELYYFNGPKLSINLQQQYILVWNNEFDNYENWFMIKCSQDLFEKYLTKQVSLLDVIENCIKIDLIERNYENYDVLKIKATNIDNIQCSDEKYKIKNFILPTKNSFLMIDFDNIK